MDTFLAPVENPRNPMLKLVYAMTRRQFGKVLTPIKIVYARMPLAFGSFIGKICKARQEVVNCHLKRRMLIRERVAPHQRVPFLHRYCARLHDQVKDERSEVRCIE